MNLAQSIKKINCASDILDLKVIHVNVLIKNSHHKTDMHQC
jgi:hypothetical protein